MDYHHISVKETYTRLHSAENGLCSAEAEERLMQYGRNELVEKHKVNPILLFLGQFKNFFVIILLAVMGISLFLGEWAESIAVLVILILIAVLGFIQEYKAERAIEALKKMATPKAHVIRDGAPQEIDSALVVPGDILVLQTGDKIAADARLIEAVNLETQEAALTGESVPVQKELKPLPEHTIVANRKNMVYSGTIITMGRGYAIVTATGMGTEFGKIATMIQETAEGPTPLQVKLEQLGHTLGVMTLIICGLIFGFGLWKEGISHFLELLKTSIALAVAAIPEGLPAVVTIALALGVQRMIKRHALIRRLPSVETLGSTTVICTDKTGTLTHNEMTVRRLFVNNRFVDVSGSGYHAEGKFSEDARQFEMLLTIGLLNNDAHIIDKEHVVGDPTEACLLASAAKGGLSKDALQKRFPRIDELQFTSERKRMTTIHKSGKAFLSLTKGAPDIIINHCDRILINGKVLKLTKTYKDTIIGAETQFASEALRVLGFAYHEMAKADKKNAEKDMVFVGLQAMIDPPRMEVKDAIARCKRAGIKVVMITGDYIGTAKAIANELGIEGDAITGEELEGMEDFDCHVERIGVYARVNPEHKKRIIEAFKKKGHIVAMTGDGVNDAPALKNADIGIAMGVSGTDVAREASDMILTDDNFASIVNAVEEGRGIYDNIRKFVQFLVGCNIGEIVAIFFSVLLGLPTPLLPLQILLMNLVTDGLPALALGVEPVEPDIMERKPRKPKEKIFSAASLVYLLSVGLIIGFGTLGLFWYYLNSHGLAYAHTVAFTTIVMFQLFHAFNCKSERKSLFRIGPISNRFLVLAVISSIAIQLIVIYSPLHAFFGTVSLNLQDWGRIILMSLSVVVFAEGYKLVRGKSAGEDGRA